MPFFLTLHSVQTLLDPKVVDGIKMELFGETAITRKTILEGGANDAPITVFETTSHYNYDHNGCIDFSLDFAASSKCSSCKCQDCKVKHNGVINAINALTTSVKKMTSKSGVIPSKRISYPDTPLDIKATKRKRKDTSKASSIIQKIKIAMPLSLSCTDVDVTAIAEEHNMIVDNPSTAFKDEEKVDPVSLGEWKNYPFKGFNISDEAPKKQTQFINDYLEWIDDGLLNHYAGRKQNDERYKVNKLSLRFDMFDFVVAHPGMKNWFYLMSQPQTCWNDEHIDVIFFYVQKKAKLQTQEQYRYTTGNYLYKVYIDNAYDRFVLIGRRLKHTGIKWLIHLMYNMLTEFPNKPLVAWIEVLLLPPMPSIRVMDHKYQMMGLMPDYSAKDTLLVYGNMEKRKLRSRTQPMLKIHDDQSEIP
ncbi:hypothetical protein BC332_04285 [Capsicum chinense]|nr:hypothetical protein BC332_04285 [Capsicum chinense]